VKKYKPSATPYLFDRKVLTSHDRVESAIESARDTVLNLRSTISRTEELIVQSRELLEDIKEQRSHSAKQNRRRNA